MESATPRAKHHLLRVLAQTDESYTPSFPRTPKSDSRSRSQLLEEVHHIGGGHHLHHPLPLHTDHHHNVSDATKPSMVGKIHAAENIPDSPPAKASIRPSTCSSTNKWSHARSSDDDDEDEELSPRNGSTLQCPAEKPTLHNTPALQPILSPVPSDNALTADDESCPSSENPPLPISSSPHASPAEAEQSSATAAPPSPKVEARHVRLEKQEDIAVDAPVVVPTDSESTTTTAGWKPRRAILIAVGGIVLCAAVAAASVYLPQLSALVSASAEASPAEAAPPEVSAQLAEPVAEPPKPKPTVETRRGNRPHPPTRPPVSQPGRNRGATDGTAGHVEGAKAAEPRRAGRVPPRQPANPPSEEPPKTA